MPAWNTTDDTPVPVHAGKKATVKSTMQPSSMPRMQRSVGMPAVFGMTVVLLGVGWYMGLGETLLGSLGSNEQTHTITVTEDGHFDPSDITVLPGDEVTIVNKNVDPQVLKAIGGRELFETLVLFEDPYTFTVSADAKGPYIYGSETLPVEETVTITVSVPVEVTASTSSSSSTSDPIPIPFNTQDVKTASTASSSSVAAVVTTHQSGPATISLGGNTSSASSASAKTTSATIPTNPYTVHATGADQYIANTQALANANEQLHSGAPLAQYANYRPPVTTSTGPEHASALVLLASGFLFWVVTRRFMTCK